MVRSPARGLGQPRVANRTRNFSMFAATAATSFNRLLFSCEYSCCQEVDKGHWQTWRSAIGRLYGGYGLLVRGAAFSLGSRHVCTRLSQVTGRNQVVEFCFPIAFVQVVYTTPKRRFDADPLGQAVVVHRVKCPRSRLSIGQTVVTTETPIH
jgi:hypothetical protein